MITILKNQKTVFRNFLDAAASIAGMVREHAPYKYYTCLEASFMENTITHEEHVLLSKIFTNACLVYNIQIKSYYQDTDQPIVTAKISLWFMDVIMRFEKPMIAMDYQHVVTQVHKAFGGKVHRVLWARNFRESEDGEWYADVTAILN